MRMTVFAGRTAKEILRDPLTICFGLGFPIVLLLLLSAIQANIPVSLFEIEELAPGIAVFGLSFITLFSATLISKDRTGALLQRLYTTPLTASDYILGYTLPLVPIAAVQCVICFFTALVLGLEFSIETLLAVLAIIPAALFFIGMGLLFGSVLNDKQVGGICGALLTNLTGWLSGIWFDLDLVGGWFKSIANLLPFTHAVELERAVISGSFGDMFPHLWWVIGYAVVTFAAAVILFKAQMKRN